MSTNQLYHGFWVRGCHHVGTEFYGFRDPEYFKLKILGIHETRYALVG